MAISRIYVGAHYPLDVLAGAAVGLAGGWIAVEAAKRTGIAADFA